MKINIILSIYLLTYFSALPGKNAQGFYMMLTNRATWDVVSCFSFYSSGWHVEIKNILTDADVMINSVSYKQVSQTTKQIPRNQFVTKYNHFLAGILEALNKAFFVSQLPCLDTYEKIVYDFSLIYIGNTIYNHCLNCNLKKLYPHFEFSFDSVADVGKYHRRKKMTDSTCFFSKSWVDRIVNYKELVFASSRILAHNSYDISCFNECDCLKFTNPSPFFESYHLSQPIIICASTTGGSRIDKNSTASAFSYPFRSDGIIKLNFLGNDKYSITKIYDAIGCLQIVSTQESVICEISVDFSQWTEGAYFIFLNDESTNIPRVKIIKVKQNVPAETFTR